MSIIYDALQKTQRNREYIRMQQGVPPKRSYRQHYLALGLTLAVLALMGGAYWASLYFKSQSPKATAVKAKPALKQKAVTEAPRPRGLENTDLWVTENQPKLSQPLAQAKPQEIPVDSSQMETPTVVQSDRVAQAETPAYLNRLILNGVLISDRDKTALINNQAYHIGDMVDGMRIVTIDSTRVRLQSGPDLLELRIAV